MSGKIPMKEKLKEILQIPKALRSQNDLEELSSLIGDIKIFEDYKYSSKLKLLCQHLNFISYGIKHQISIEGQEGDAFYLILSGRVGLYINTNKYGKTRLNSIAELKEGDSFGESGLLYGAKYTASAITTTNVELMVLKKEDYDQEFKGDEMLIQRKIANFFRKQGIFKQLPEDKLEFIVKKTKKPIDFKTSDVIVKQGSAPDAFYFIAKGRAKVLKRLDFKKTQSSLTSPTPYDYEYRNFQAKIIEIEEIAKPSLIGGYEALRNLPYNFSVICTMPCSVYKVSLSDLKLLDLNEMQYLINACPPPLSDNDIRLKFYNDNLWNTYKNNFIDSVRKEKKFKIRFNFRMPATNWHKGRSFTPENMFGMPQTHLKLAPIERIIPSSRN
ncbi:hypothetical protein SteCoe_15251 [Stentor coeruleus]|uniref:Cyclic nucleotide-binding domain-containing protein n=1 Tax=Stentor coeruleus TaxID=5963 RepID=A0A1R2C425_9CILI|nr:hypothetical protein SteCoe_15251 [Stentor coeruleus]